MPGVRVLLDTNICVYIIKRNPPQVAEAFRKYRSGEVGISSVTVAELAYGVAKSRRPGTREALEEFLTELVTLPFDDAAAWEYGQLRAHLFGQGTPIGPFDLQIAAQALSLGVPLVTNNEREFQRVPGLKVENWFGA